MKKEYSIISINLGVMFLYQIILFSSKNPELIIQTLATHASINVLTFFFCIASKKVSNDTAFKFLGAGITVLLIGFPMCFVLGLATV